MGMLFESPSIVKGAEFSPCRWRRYALWRLWSDGPCLMVIGLNPSTADETQDDPTIRRCITFARTWCYSGLYMLNLFAFRATDPRLMKATSDPIGPGNNEALKKYSDMSARVLAAWGTHGEFMNRDVRVCELLDRQLHCLNITKNGFPQHPLYVKGDTIPKVFYDPKDNDGKPV